MPSNLFKGYQGDQVGQVNILPSVAKNNEMIFAGMSALGEGLGVAITKYKERVDKENAFKAYLNIDKSNVTQDRVLATIPNLDVSKTVDSQISEGWAAQKTWEAQQQKENPDVKINPIDEQTYRTLALQNYGKFIDLKKGDKNSTPQMLDVFSKYRAHIDATKDVYDERYASDDYVATDSNKSLSGVSIADLLSKDKKASEAINTGGTSAVNANLAPAKVYGNVSGVSKDSAIPSRASLLGAGQLPPSKVKLADNTETNALLTPEFIKKANTELVDRGTSSEVKATVLSQALEKLKSGNGLELFDSYRLANYPLKEGQFTSTMTDKERADFKNKLTYGYRQFGELEKGAPTIAEETHNWLKDTLSQAIEQQGGTWGKATGITTLTPENRVKAQSFLQEKLKEVQTESEQLAPKLQEAQKDPQKAAVEALAKATGEGYTAATGKPAPTSQEVIKTEQEKLSEALQFGDNADLSHFTAGTAFSTQEKTWDEKKMSMQKYMMENFGGVPSNFDDIFYAQHPEAAMSVVNFNGHDVLINKKTGGMTELNQLKGVDEDTLGKAKARVFGMKTIQGTDTSKFGEVVQGSGIYARGKSIGGDDVVKDFRERVTNASRGVVAAKQLLDMMNSGKVESMDATMKGNSKPILLSLISAMRPLYEKGVRISQYSNSQLYEASGNPTDFITLDMLTKPRLEQLQKELAAVVKADGDANNVEVIYKPKASGDEVIHNHTLAKLNAKK